MHSITDYMALGRSSPFRASRLMSVAHEVVELPTVQHPLIGYTGGAGSGLRSGRRPQARSGRTNE